MAANLQDDPLPQMGSSYHNPTNNINRNANNSDLIQMGSYFNTSNNSLMFCDGSNSSSSTSCSTSVGTGVNCGVVAGGNSGGGCGGGGSLLLDTVPGLKHDAALAVEWTEDEQFKLEEGLLKYKDEPSIMKYIKIAAMLRDKTVRDVALRCRWMTRKRRKQEESHLGRKGNYRKDKVGESSSKANLPSASIPTSVGYSFSMNPTGQSQRVKCEVLSGKAKQLLQQNMQAFTQINNNLSFLKLQDNIDLFCRARDNINNISAILNDLRGVSVKINQMHDLPICIDQNLANSILPHTTPETVMCGMVGGVQPKQESKCW